MRIGCLQFAPQVGDVDNNLNRADAVLNKAQDVEDLDLLVLPELAFTGYNFRSLADISPFLEPSGSGISALWARTTALKFNCNVVVGYPEKVDVAQKWPTSPEFYNSAIIINSDGETIANYRKSFLYAIDETWALEGQDGFFEGYIPGMGDVAMGICMDLNPYRFEAPWHDFEFAFHVLEVKANLVILTMAWLTREGAHSFSQLPQEPDLQTLEYWVQRLEPIVRSDSDEEIIVVLCNRSGTEGDAVYAGTSTVLGVKHGEVNLYGVLGRGVKELLVVDTEKAPFAKLLQAGHSSKSKAGKSEGYDSNRSMVGSSPNASHKSASLPRKRPFFPFRDVVHAEGYDSESLETPIEDIEDAWEITSTAASVGSVRSSNSRAGPTPSRGSVPKLELQIPTGTESSQRPPQSKGPVSATRDQEGKSAAVDGDEIPTPTAPTPTPMSVRPYFAVSDKIPPVSLRSHIDLPDSIPSSQSRPDSVPHFMNTKGGGSAVKVKRADTPITPPWVTGAKEKARGPTPISEAPPSPPSDGEGTGTGTQNSKDKAAAGKKSPKSSNDNGKSVVAKDNHGKSGMANDNSVKSSHRQTPRLSTSSLSYRPNQTQSYPLASAATYGLQTATPVSAAITLDALWDDALRNLKTGDVNAAGESMYRHDDLDNILVGEAPLQAELQEQLFSEVQQKFAHLVNSTEKPPSPAPGYVPDRPPSTKSRNMSLTRASQGFDSPDLHRSMSQSRMSIPIVASPSVFRQEFQSVSQAQQSDLPMYFRAESKGSNKVDTPSRNQQTPSTRHDGRAGAQGTNSPVPSAPAQADTPSRGVNGAGVWARQVSRPVSRGRQPFTKANPTNGAPSQSMQRSNGHASRVSNSVDRGRQASNNRPPESGPPRSAVPSALSSRGRSMSTSSTNSWLFGTPPPARTELPLEPGDEIIAMINLIHNDCPVHNSRAPSQDPQSQTQTVQHDRSQSQGQSQRQGRQASQQRERQPQQQRQGTPRVQTPIPQLQQQEQLFLQQQPQTQTPVAHGGGEGPVYEVILPPHIRELVESLSSPESRVQSPLRARDLLKADRATPKFDPPTPTAMQFNVNDTKKAPASA